MGKVKDLTGIRFGKLVATKPSGEKYKNNLLWICKCDCGNETIVIAHHLLNGNTKSCGCKRKDIICQRSHGKHSTRIYRIWQDMKNRCRNANTVGYKNYGGRGISYCNEWEHFEPFYTWAMSNGYNDTLSIDRINVNGNYTPQNCKWATLFEQSRNKRDNRTITYNGKTLVLKDWEKILGIGRRTLQYRLDHGWSVKDAFSIIPIHNANQFSYAARESLKEGL